MSILRVLIKEFKHKPITEKIQIINSWQYKDNDAKINFYFL